MKAIIAAIVALASVASLASTQSIARATDTSVLVKIDGYAFKAPTVTVAPGTTVRWQNLDDDPHTVTSTTGVFDSHGLAQGDSFTYRFLKPGTYQYYCKVHPMMRGTVIVKESQS